ncbi:MAG: AraC family transcriptional regulator [Paenibacillaceae bacterium]|jgi:two-component system response regulator YesN|nr:AraC family transcriptional regulator [Paenibacillaceae bacterium]
MTMKLKMIIADDEYNVREGLKEVVAWDRLGIEVVATAEDGIELLEHCQALKPDIVLTDIRMPELDGLQVADFLRSAGYPVRIIIISGVQDFHYAKKALHLQADGYILKPVGVEELEQTVSEAAESIRSQRRKEEQELKLAQQLKENLPALRERFLAELVTGMVRNQTELADKLHFFGLMQLAEGRIVAAVLEIDNYEEAVQRFTEENKQLIMFSVTNILEEIAQRHRSCVVFSPRENHFVALFHSREDNALPHMDAIALMLDSTSTYLKMSLSAGVGNPVEAIAEVQYSYQEAQTALDYRFFTGHGTIVSIGDFGERRMQINSSRMYAEQNELIHYMKLGKEEEVSRAISSIFEQLGRESNCSISYVQSIAVEMVNQAYRSLHELGEKVENVLPGWPEIMAELYSQHHLTDLIVWLQQLFRTMTRFFLQKNNQKNSRTIRKIKEIIAQHYMENITMSRLAEEVFMSPNYISQIFRQETGTTVTEYVTKVRMEAAKELLKSPDLKILQVAEMIGYETAAYFSTVFKKYTGMYPQKYRSLLLDEE